VTYQAYTAHPGLNLAFLASSPVRAKVGGGAVDGTGGAREGRREPLAADPLGCAWFLEDGPPFFDFEVETPFDFEVETPLRGGGDSPGRRTPTG
jgi:hypothetical protein